MGDGKFVLKGYGSNVVGSFGSGSMVQDMPSAMQLNGTDAYANGSTNMATVTGTTATISMWVYYTGSQTNQGEKVLFSDSSSETRKILMQTRNYSSHNTSFRYGYVDSDGGGVAAKDTGGSAGVLTSGTWQHFCLVADGRSVSLHVDGEQYSDATYSAAGTNSYAITTPHLGRAAFSDGRYFPGYIRNVQVYNVSSSDAQVVELMNDEFPHGTPIHWWTCNDGATNDDGSATDSDLTLTNTVEDKSFYKLNQIGTGSVSGSVTVSGGTWNLKNNTYISPTGTNNTNANYIQLNNDQQYDGSRSYAMWFYLGATGNTQIVLDNYLSNAGTRVFINGGTTSLYLRLNNANVINFAANENEWNHLVWTIDETNNLAKGYLNGIEVTSAANDRTYGTVNNMRIGAQTDDDYPTNDGNYISEYAYYTSVLTPEQIDLLYKGQWIGRPETWLKMDEGTGTTITNHGSDGATATLTGVSSNLPVWVNPDYEIEMDAGGTTFMIEEDATLSAPRGNLVLSGTTVNQPTYKIEGIYTHNSGTMIHRNAVDVYWRPSAVNKSGVNDFHKFKIEGQKTQWARGSWNVEDSIHLEGIMRLYANSTYSEGHTLTLGTTGSQGYVSGSGYMQAMTTVGTPAGSIIQGASKLYPALLSGTHSSYKGTLAPYRSVQLGNLQFDGKVTNEASMDSPVVTLIDDVYFKGGYDAHNGETLVTTNQRAQFGANLDMESGVTFVGSGALLICDDKIKTDGATVYNSGTSVICGHAGTSTIRFNDGDWENFMYNPTGGGVSFDTNTNVANNLIIAGGYYDMTTTHLSGGGVGKLQIATGGEFRGGDSTNHLITDTFNQAGGFIGQGAINVTGVTDVSAQYMTAASFDDLVGASEATIECWFRASDSNPESAGLVSLFPAAEWNINVNKSGSDLYLGWEWENHGSEIFTSNGPLLGPSNAQKWHHAAMTIHDTNGYKVYLDGKLAASGGTNGNDADVSSVALTVGSSYYSTNYLKRGFSGDIARASVWKTALTESNIRDMLFYDWAAVSGSSIDQTKCVAWYEFSDRYTQLDITDMSGSGNTGTLSEDVWAVGGTFTDETCTLEFDNDGTLPNTYNFFMPRDGTQAEYWGISVTSGSALAIDNADGEKDVKMYGPLVNSGATFTNRRNFQYYNSTGPVVGASSDLTVGNNTFYYFPSSAGSLQDAAGTTYYDLRPGNGANVTMQGDFTANSRLAPYSDAVLNFNGYKGTLAKIQTYNSGNIVLDPGSTINFTNTNGFLKDEGGGSRSYITASGEACAQFYGDDNDGYGNYITLPKTSALDFGNSAFTITFWAKLGDDADEEYMISNMNSPDSAWPGFRFGLKHGDLNNQINDNSGGGAENRYNTNIPTDTWKHIAIVASGSGEDMVCYVDGSVPVAGQSLGTYASLNNAKTIKIGGAYQGDTQSFNGSLADIRFYKSALSAANITTLSSENPVISVSGAYADPDNDLSATVWLKLGMTLSGTMDLKNYGTSGSANDGTWVTSGSPPRLGKSGIVTVTGSAGYKPINYPFQDMTLTNTYMSGSQDIVVGQYSSNGTAVVANTAAKLITKGTVVLD